MKAIIDGKLYDTENAEKVYSHRRKHVSPSMFLPEGLGFVEWRDVTIWKTARGAYFEAEEYEGGPKGMSVISEADLREKMSRLNPDKYMQVFGAVEEG